MHFDNSLGLIKIGNAIDIMLVSWITENLHEAESICKIQLGEAHQK